MSGSVDLSKVMSFINQRYVFGESSYPALRKIAGEEALQFAVNHSLLHMQKSLGKIATEVESADHGGVMDKVAIGEATVKMLVNTLVLAEVMGISAEMLAEMVPAVMKSK